jgi:hypothetical protein
VIHICNKSRRSCFPGLVDVVVGENFCNASHRARMIWVGQWSTSHSIYFRGREVL